MIELLTAVSGESVIVMVGGGDKGDLVLYHSPFYTQTHYTYITHWLVGLPGLAQLGVNHQLYVDVQQQCDATLLWSVSIPCPATGSEEY